MLHRLSRGRGGYCTSTYLVIRTSTNEEYPHLQAWIVWVLVQIIPVHSSSDDVRSTTHCSSDRADATCRTPCPRTHIGMGERDGWCLAGIDRVLKTELINAQLQSKLSCDVDSKIAKQQREYYLMEQLRGIKELGMEGSGGERWGGLDKLASLGPTADEAGITGDDLRCTQASPLALITNQDHMLISWADSVGHTRAGKLLASSRATYARCRPLRLDGCQIARSRVTRCRKTPWLRVGQDHL